MDARLKLLSYSSLLTLHSCPRKFQLYRLNSQAEAGSLESETSQNVTFAFGHVVGEGIALVFAGASEEQVIWQMFLGWHADLEDRNIKQVKSFYHAVAAIQRLISLRECGFLEEYEVLEYNGKPAIELAFRIGFPDGFKMRGSVDVVLKHKETGQVLILECKTSSAANINPASYKNSAQAIGYSVVLDVIAPGLSGYEVLYLVYQTKNMSYEQYRFSKSYLQRALWIQELLLDIETIKLYEGSGVYPMRGESCLDFYRECEYLNLCTLTTKHLVTPEPPEDTLDTKIYDVELTLMDLVNAQVDKNTADINNRNTVTDVLYRESEDELL